MTRKRSGILGLLFLVVVGLAATGLFVAQQRYIRHHLPLIRAQLTNAEAEGPKMLERIGVPAGSTVISAVNQAIYGSGSTRRGMWSDNPCAVKWTSTWDVIGTQNETLDWYRQRLLGNGWEPYNQRVPSKLQTLYWKDKWLLTIGHNVAFPMDHPPHARFELVLIWDYWHQLKQTSQDNAEKASK
jgi:hypothetical protein